MKTIISKGNNKLGHIPNVSLLPCVTCPKNVPCSKDCYAQKFLKYPSVKRAWTNNTDLLFSDRIKYFTGIRDFLLVKKPAAFRWHVAGDIIDQNYLDHMKRAAIKNDQIRFLAFTKAYDLDFHRLPLNLSIIFSMWNNYGNTTKHMPRAWLYNPKNPDMRIPRNAIQCHGKCIDCGMCWELKTIGRDVVFNKH